MNNLLISILFCFSCLFRVEAAEEVIESNYVKGIAETIESFNTEEANRIWPGFNLNQMPTIIHFKEEGAIYGYGIKESAEWTKTRISSSVVLVSEEDHWGVRQNMMHPAFEINDQSAFLFYIDKESDPATTLLTFIHERFHLYQFQHFEHEKSRLDYLDQWNEDNLLLIRLEDKILKAFLLEKDSKKKVEILKDFLAVNNERQKIIHPYSAAWESHQQRMEGLADYVSFKAVQAFALFNDFSPEGEILDKIEQHKAAGVSFMKEVIKGRHYIVGSTLGLALDFCNVNWKEKVEQGSSLITVLDQSLPQSEQEKNKRFLETKKRYEIEKIKVEMLNDLVKEKEDAQEVEQTYARVDGIIVKLFKPYQKMSGGGKNQKNLFLGNGRIAAVLDTSFAMTEDQQWQLSFKEIPCVFEGPGGVKEFKVEETLILLVDGKEYTLNELLKMPESVQYFTSLSWNSANSELHTKLSGRLYINNGALTIEFR